jgi:hypothetical protein
MAAVFTLTATAMVYAAFFQGFETDTAGWFNTTRVPTETHLVPSKGGLFHAEFGDNDGGATFTQWGSYSKTFPTGGYTTTVDVYLDIASPYGSATELTPYANDTRFDWSSAIGDPDCGHRRDFVFNAGFYTDDDATGAGPRFVISASNNATRSSSNPKNPGRNPFSIFVEGWYTLEHRFRAVPDAPGGQLYVDMKIKDALGVTLYSWTLSDASDIIGTTVGGNRYGWFVFNELPFLAFDNSELIGVQDYCVPPSTDDAKITGGGSIDVADGIGTFGFVGKVAKDGSPGGHLTFQDHGAGNRNVNSIAITSVTTSGQCGILTGTATVDGSGSVAFQVRVCDNGEPGTNDTFSITMSDGYSAGGTLTNGNIQLH